MVSIIFGKTCGFFAGWGMLVASVFFMVSATITAATSTLLMISHVFNIHSDIVENTNLVAFTASIWLSLITIVVIKGIKSASYVQIIFTIIETVIVFALIVAGFIQYWDQPAHIPSFSWLSPLSFTPNTFAAGALIAIFFYWGWDVTMNLSEETGNTDTNTSKSSGSNKGAFWAMVNLILFFIIMMVVVLIVLSDAEIAAANTNVLYAVADKLFPKPWSHLAVLSTILSTIGTIETQILQFSRGMFAMARDKALHPRYAIISTQWQTPWIATLVIWGLGIILLGLSSMMPSVKSILDSSVLAIGFHICFYMSLAGFACVWHYRNVLFKGTLKDKCSYVLWPLISSLFMVFLGLYLLPTFDVMTTIIALGGLLIGIIPLTLGMLRNQ